MFGFDVDYDDEIEGFNSFQTSYPAPLIPAPRIKRGDLVVPDSFVSVPEAVWASSDGSSLFVRPGNHTWLGVGRSGLTAESAYNLEVVAREGMSWEYVRSLNGAVLVPPGPDSSPVLNELLCEYADPDVDSFCLHITGEEGARLCGRWLLKPASVGSFSGVETVFEQNETAVHAFEDVVSPSPPCRFSLPPLARWLALNVIPCACNCHRDASIHVCTRVSVCLLSAHACACRGSRTRTHARTRAGTRLRRAALHKHT